MLCFDQPAYEKISLFGYLGGKASAEDKSVVVVSAELCNREEDDNCAEEDELTYFIDNVQMMII